MGKGRNKRTGKGPTEPEPCLRLLPLHTTAWGLMRSILPPQRNGAESCKDWAPRAPRRKGWARTHVSETCATQGAVGRGEEGGDSSAPRRSPSPV